MKNPYRIVYRVLFSLIAGCLVLPSLFAQTISRPFTPDASGQQTFVGTFGSSNDTLRVDLGSLSAGNRLDIAVSGDAGMDFVLQLETPTGTLIQDEDSNAREAWSPELDTAGVYTLLLYSLTDGGAYTLTLQTEELPAMAGAEPTRPVNNTESLLDTFQIETDVQVVSAEDALVPRNTTRTLTGQLADSTASVTAFAQQLQPGDTLYVVAEGLDGVDPFVRVFSPDFQYVLSQDDDSGGDRRAALALTVDAYGDYAITLFAVNNAVGGYRLTIGTNDPSILTDEGISDLAYSAERPFDCAVAPDVERPQLSGSENLLDAEHVRIHYTLSGSDATTEEYVLLMRDALENSLTVQFDTLGWRIPPTDCGAGGDDRLDVYVMNIDYGAIGYASPENLVGDNPNTPEREFFSAYSHLVIENDMDFADADEAFDFMQITAAHEVHHNIQFGYDTNETYYGFYESGAMWIETLVYPQLTDAYDYTEVFDYPDLCIGSRDPRVELRIYAEWLMIDSFTRDLGVESYQKLWEYLARHDDLVGFFDGLLLLGTTPETVVRRMAIRNLLLDYANAARFGGSVDIETVIDGIGTIRPERDGVQQQGVDYIEITTPGNYTFSVPEGNFTLSLVGIQGDEARSFALGRGGTVDTRDFDHAVLIVQNIRRYANTDECTFSDWAVEVDDGDQYPPTPPDDTVWDASHYRE